MNLRLLLNYFSFPIAKLHQRWKGNNFTKIGRDFWFDMSKTSAANNRRVNIRKLRLILETVGEVQIVNKMIIGILIWVKIPYVIIIRYARS